MKNVLSSKIIQRVFLEQKTAKIETYLSNIKNEGVLIFRIHYNDNFEDDIFVQTLKALGAPEICLGHSNVNAFYDWITELSWLEFNEKRELVLFVENSFEYWSKHFYDFCMLQKLFQSAGNDLDTQNISFKVVFLYNENFVKKTFLRGVQKDGGVKSTIIIPEFEQWN